MHIWEAWVYTYNDEHELTSKNYGGLSSIVAFKIVRDNVKSYLTDRF